jgi:hypothetical protein
MLGIKPNKAMWHRMNVAALNGAESVGAGELLVTILGAAEEILFTSGVCASREQARAHLAAMLISPDTAPKAGSLMPLLKAELVKLDDGKWIT